ncbi:uncharacterized protein LOC110686790 [Chenopodium quinoa]|uniref:uncharacterized protein LOC110686790 n=1 Tax=Chenopodium quinoa TaxID=63459 RepID=UPI000B776055|nr:uncharacterized protein LOC110686790 [Chenopodium quinoa]
MLGDILELLYMGDGAFKVHIWRGGQYIHDFVEISSDSSEDIEQIENDAKIEEPTLNDAEMEEVSHNDAWLEEDSLSLPNDRCSWIPDFEVRYTGPYSAMGRMNVPLKFTRIHFSFFRHENPAEIWDRNNKMWKAKLFVKRDSNGKIVLCNIRGQGVDAWCEGYGWEEGHCTVASKESTRLQGLNQVVPKSNTSVIWGELIFELLFVNNSFVSILSDLCCI